MAHSLVSTFLYPALLCSRPISEALLQGKGNPNLVPEFVYPQLEGMDVKCDNSKEVFRILSDKTSSLPPYDLGQFIYAKETLLDKLNRQELTTFILTLSVGRRIAC
jgi:hypothetical protein